MPRTSKRSLLLPSSPIRKLSGYAAAAKRRGIRVFHLNIGQPDIETLPAFTQALSKLHISILDYGPSEGFLNFREKLAEYYTHYGLNIQPEHILTTIGASEAILVAFNVCLDEHDEIIIPEPSYSNYFAYAHLNTCAVVPITTHLEDNFALPSIERFKEKINAKTKAILISNPNNPTGYVYTYEEIMALRDLALEKDLFIISDEAYREFCYDGVQHVSIMSMEGMEQNAVLIDSISKRYSACGARLGMLVSKNEDLLAGALKYAQMRLCPPTIEQEAGALAFSPNNFEYLQRANKEYAKRRNLAVKLLSEIPGVTLAHPKGAFYIIASLPIDDSDRFCKWLLEEFSFNKSTVMLAPGSGFYSSPPRTNTEVRIAYVLKENDLKSALECLAKALEVYNSRTKPS